MADEKPAVPGMRFWTPGHEADYQKFMAFDPDVREWRRGFETKFGEKPNEIDDPSFDYRAAYLNGDRPSVVEGDTVMHWPSSGKAADHPTAWMNGFMQQFGVDPAVLPKEGASPAMQEFMTQELLRHYVEDAVKRPGYTPEEQL